jgi:hypothetical protein
MAEEEARLRMEEARLRMEEARARAAERPIEEEHLITRNVVARRVDDVQGDPEDKCFLMSYGWLYFIWWLFNIVDTILCLLWFSAAVNGYRSSNTAWIPIVVWLIALLFNRLAYEGSIAFFEMVRHLRQIRDELRRHNMREDKREYEAREKLQRCEIPEGKDGEGCQTGM